MGLSAWSLALRVAVCMGLAIACAVAPARRADAQQATPSSYDEQLRALQYYRYKRVAESGPERGRELYYFKCWQCHNEFQKTAPQLKGLYQRGTLVDRRARQRRVAGGADQERRPRHAVVPLRTERRRHRRPRQLRARQVLLGPGEPAAQSAIRAMRRRRPSMPGKGNRARRPVGLRALGRRGRRRRSAAASQGSTGATPLEGIMVQLRGDNSNITTTVYTDETGRFEFPKLRAGSYTLRIVRALEFKPYQQAALAIAAARRKLDDIVLEPVSSGEFVPANWDIAAQLAGAELVWNLDGTAQEKRTFSYGCGSGCHTYGQILRNRFDERELAADRHQDDPQHRVAAAVPGRCRTASRRRSRTSSSSG